MKRSVYILFSLITGFAFSQQYTRQDSLRSSNNEFRNWWDLKHYEITVEPDISNKSIKGTNIISFEVTQNNHSKWFQVDLQEPMLLTEIKLNNQIVTDFRREGNVYFINTEKKLKKEGIQKLALNFEGNPRIAVNAPWDGGWIFTKDEKGRDWVTAACQGLGASAWFPAKEYLGDEPDNGVILKIIVPKELTAVGNGRLIREETTGEKKQFTWEVKNPINNYNIIPYIGYYKEIKESYDGENGTLELDYWVLDYNVEKAKKQFQQVPMMLASFEDWFGPYPFYEDTFKVVDAPHLGMEHQSNIAYGNNYANGYLGGDLSRTGWGLKFDFIIVHESGHEWFGNNISKKDVADMWIHEGFTAYSEALYVETYFGKEAGSQYAIGTRTSIENDKPIIGVYGVNQRGSGDMYYKGSNIILSLRAWIDDDILFKKILRGLNSEFYHQTVTTEQVENYIAKKSKLNLKPFFDQYLRTTDIPVVEYKIEDNKLSYRYANVVEGFNMPIKILDSNILLYPSSEWQSIDYQEKSVVFDPEFFVKYLRL